MSHAAIILPIRPEDIEPLRTAAANDNHVLMYPTHVIWKNGQIAGYVSICNTPIVNVWTSTQSVTARDSVELLRTIDALAAASGRVDYIMPCAEDSPYFIHLAKLGFQRFGTTTLNHKNLWDASRQMSPCPPSSD